MAIIGDDDSIVSVFRVPSNLRARIYRESPIEIPISPLANKITTSLKFISQLNEIITGKNKKAAIIFLVMLISNEEYFLVRDLQIKQANVQENAAPKAAIIPGIRAFFSLLLFVRAYRRRLEIVGFI